VKDAGTSKRNTEHDEYGLIKEEEALSAVKRKQAT